MTTMHKRWSNRVTLPVGKQWGTVEGGVAACMTWDSGPRPPPTPQVVRVPTPHRTPSRAASRAYRQEPEVRFSPRLDDYVSSRQNGEFELHPVPYDSARESEFGGTQRGGLSYRRAPTPVGPVTVHRENTALGTPYLETEVTEVVRGQNKDAEFAVNERLGHAGVKARPPRAPKPRARSAAPRGTRRVEYSDNYGRPELKVIRPNSAHAYPNKTVSFRSGANSTIGYGGYDYVTPRYVYDDDLEYERDLEPYYQTSTGKGSHFRSWRDANKVATPDLRKYLHQPLQRSSSHDNLWKMKKFANTKSKVVTHWDDDTSCMRAQPPESPGKVNVVLDCPDDSDMTVNVTVNTSRGSGGAGTPVRGQRGQPARVRRAAVPRPPSKNLAWY